MAYFLSPALAQLRTEINRLWPHRDKTSDGWIGDTSHQARPSDHNPDWSDGGIVRAIDIDEDLVAGLTATGEAMPLVDQIIRDARTRYVIYEGRIWTRENGWRPYSGVNAHRHHIHVSVRSVGNYDRDTRSWGITRSTSNGSGGTGSITYPTIPGAPAPITPEDDMAQVPQDQWANLYALVQNIAGWVYLGGKGVSAGDAAGGTIAQRSINVDRQLTGAQGNSTNVVDAVGVLLARTADVARKDGPVSIRQEIADSKSLSAEAVALLAGQAELIRQLLAGGGSPVQIDYDRIDASMRAAVAEGASEVIDAIEDGIDVDITVTTPTTKKG